VDRLGIADQRSGLPFTVGLPKKQICCENSRSLENFHGSILRFCDQNRIAIDPDWFLIAIVIAIAFSKSGSGCEMKIADRC
jgi:hypothetical protein